MIRRVSPVLLAVPLLAAAPAAAETTTVRADRAVARVCSDLRPSDTGRPGVAAARFTPRVAGFAEVELEAARGDWDLTVLDARSGHRHGAAATFGPREKTIAATTPGRELLVLACRRSGRARTATIGFETFKVDLEAVAKADHARLVRVPLAGHEQFEKLEATGLDVTHNHPASFADVVLYTAADAAKLLRNGFTFSVRDANLRETTWRTVTKRSAAGLPSGRTTYRLPVDFENDLKKIVTDNPLIARPISIGKTIEGRSIEGVELAEGVNGLDDGRPTFLVIGAHHAREWPSAEMPMEFATDLAKSHASGDARVIELLRRVRVIAVPVINKDGFEVSRTAGQTPFDDELLITLPLILTDSAAYKRKNCRPSAGDPVAPCATRPAVQGVDPNRNYGAYFGGVGSSTNPAAQNHRGAGPFSEPETEAVHRLSSTREITTIISHHTFTEEGVWLRQPGFCTIFTRAGCQADDDIVPDEAGMAALGDAMAAASGWTSQLGWAIGEITGATEDWNYFSQSAFGFTPEQRGPNFHPNFQTAVLQEYDGTGPDAQGGVREALLRAAEQAANPKDHSVIAGAAPAGRVLRLRKAFDTPTSLAGVVVKDQLDFTTTVPATGRYEWHVNPSTRPLSKTEEAYTLTCETPEGAVLETREVVVGRGQTLGLDLKCASGGRPESTPAPAATPPAVEPTQRTSFGTRLYSTNARVINRRGRFRVGLRVYRGAVTDVRARLTRGKRVVARASRDRAEGRTTLSLRTLRRVRAGRHVLTVTARSGARTLRSRTSVQVRR